MKNGGDNGGFPRAPEGVETAVVECRHSACAGVTRVIVPRVLSPSALKIVVCANCGREYQPGIGSIQPLVGGSASRPNPNELPPEFFLQGRSIGSEGSSGRSRSRATLLLLVPLLAVATIAGLAVIRAIETDGQGSGGDSAQTAPPEGSASVEAKQIVGQGYTFVLAAGWAATEPPEGARYSAVSEDGLADVTLWVDTESELEFPEFVEVSLAELRQTASSASIVSRTPAATPEESVVVIATTEREGQPHQVVTLRFNGPYRYYFTTTTQSDASTELRDQVAAMHESFTPISISGGDGSDVEAESESPGSNDGSDQ